MKDVCIVAAKRTPHGRFMGALAKRSSVQLAVDAGRAALEGIGVDEIDHVAVGNVLGAGQGMNVARQIAVGLGIPIDRIAFTVNMMCASGMQAVFLGAQAIIAGQAKVVLCGGTESMSNAPYLLDRARRVYKLGDGVLIDSMLRDGLVDAFSDEHMALTVERLAERRKISRAAQDEFALGSQQKYAEANSNGVFDREIVPVEGVTADEHPRPETTLDVLAGLKPAFTKDGTVTAGNASGINDGAAMLVVCDGETAARRSWPVLARLTAWASIGCDPGVMGLGPAHATRKLCQENDVSVDDFDMVELNEAFAGQVLACVDELQIAPERLNVAGGAIALGHPIGASAARLIVHLAHRVAAGESERALATLCVGGGMGSAAMLERA